MVPDADGLVQNCYIVVRPDQVTVNVHGLLDGYAVVIVPLNEYADYADGIKKFAARVKAR